MPVPGDRVDGFELEESIGAGGMGAVFRAVDLKLDRQVALKILPPDQAVDPEVVRRYHQEGRAAARLDHENIARVYTIGDDGRYHYIVFEYIEGTTLRQRVERDGPIAVGDAINFTLQIANALVHAAARGVVHRDIKPSNIIVTPEGRAKLVDMGLARRFERGEDTGLTQSGMTLGTFDYISPEQARDPRDVDVRGDLYSLGCTLFYMLTGRPPFPDGTVLQKLIQHQEEPPPDVRALNPGVPVDLAAVLVKLMAKDRDHRYQAPEQLARDLLAVAAAMGLRPRESDGRAWVAPAPAPGWVGHLAWGVPGLAFLVILAAIALWGDGPASSPAIEPSRTSTAKAAPPAVGRSTVEAGPTRPRPAPEPEAPREFAVAPGGDPLRVAAEAPSGSTIVLTGKGPYDFRGDGSRRMTGFDVTIRADVGVRPLIRLPRDSGLDFGPPAAMLDIRGGRVALEGLEFVLESAGLGSDRDEVTAIVRVEDAEVSIRRCSFRRPGGARGVRAAAIVARSTSRGRELADHRLPTTLRLDACDFEGGQAGVIASGPVDLSARDCTFGPAPADLATFWCDNPEASAVRASIHLAHVSVLIGPGPAFRFSGTVARARVEHSAFAPPSSPPASPPATLVAVDVPDRLDWSGSDNLFARIAVYLRPGGTRPPIRSFEAWTDDPSAFREMGSVPSEGHPWEERNPLSPSSPDPGRGFRLALPRSSPVRPGARQGPIGPLPPPVLIALSPGQAPNPAPPESLLAPPRPKDRDNAPPPAAPMPIPTPRDRPDEAADEMKQMPLTLPPVGKSADARGDEPDPVPMPIGPDRPALPEAPAVPRATETTTAIDPGPIRAVGALLDALSRAGSAPRTLTIAADADLAVPSSRSGGSAPLTIRADRGPTRPRLRFRPDPGDPDGRSAWMTVGSGGLRIEGVDLVLTPPDPASGQDPDRPWAGFLLRPGAHLTLVDCTATIEAADARSALVAIAADAAVEAAEAEAPGRARFSNCLLGVDDDLVDVSAGASVDLELDDSAVATGGVLVHGHGLARGRSHPGPIKVGLRRVDARLGGGLVRLESTTGRPELPMADLAVRESILATVAPETPLIRVDGQGDLDALRDRVRWEGRSVAYHRIATYRRDGTAQPGVLPVRFDRNSWEVAVGLREESPTHGDLKFETEWDPDRAPATLRPEDFRLRPDGPLADAPVGPVLSRLPTPTRHP